MSKQLAVTGGIYAVAVSLLILALAISNLPRPEPDIATRAAMAHQAYLQSWDDWRASFQQPRSN